MVRTSSKLINYLQNFTNSICENALQIIFQMLQNNFVITIFGDHAMPLPNP
jgi:hypothetical protein